MNYQHNLQQLLLRIPKGKITTYREVAHAMNTRGYRFVGQLLKANPYPDQFPCYKVVKSDGSLGGYALGEAEKIRRLKADGILIKNGKIANFGDKVHRY